MRRQTTMRLFILSIVGLFVVGLVSAPPVSADCSGPSMTFEPREVIRGGEVTATGTAWGDNCYDTGPPPDGEGVLGRPVTDIEIVVTQGQNEWVVATVDAGDDYGFVARVIVPQDVEPGDAKLVARKDGTLPYVLNPNPALRISDAPAVTSRPGQDSASNPTVQETERATAENESGSQAFWLTIVAGVVVAFAAGTLVVAVRRRSP